MSGLKFTLSDVTSFLTDNLSGVNKNYLDLISSNLLEVLHYFSETRKQRVVLKRQCSLWIDAKSWSYWYYSYKTLYRERPWSPLYEPIKIMMITNLQYIKVGKPLCYHASDPGSIPRGGHTTRSPYHPRAARPTQPSILPRSANEYRIMLGLRANSGSSMMKVAPLDHHWCGGLTDGYRNLQSPVGRLHHVN